MRLFRWRRVAGLTMQRSIVCEALQKDYRRWRNREGLGGVWKYRLNRLNGLNGLKSECLISSPPAGRWRGGAADVTEGAALAVWEIVDVARGYSDTAPPPPPPPSAVPSSARARAFLHPMSGEEMSFYRLNRLNRLVSHLRRSRRMATGHYGRGGRRVGENGARKGEGVENAGIPGGGRHTTRLLPDEVGEVARCASAVTEGLLRLCTA